MAKQTVKTINSGKQATPAKKASKRPPAPKTPLKKASSKKAVRKIAASSMG